MRKLASKLLPFSLLVSFCVLWWVKTAEDVSGSRITINTLFCFLYAAWLLFEVRVSGREGGQQVADYGTREFYGAAHSATILAALWFAPGGERSLFMLVISFFLFLAGVAFRIWAIRTLGTFYSHSVRTLADHKIVDTGPYRRLRHPAYSGMLLAHIGVVLFFFSIPALLALCFGLFPAIVARILVEERALMPLDGYNVFARTRKRLAWMVW